MSLVYIMWHVVLEPFSDEWVDQPHTGCHDLLSCNNHTLLWHQRCCVHGRLVKPVCEAAGVLTRFGLPGEPNLAAFRRAFFPWRQNPFHLVAQKKTVVSLSLLLYFAIIVAHGERRQLYLTPCINWGQRQTRCSCVAVDKSGRQTDVFQLFSRRMETTRNQTNRSGEKRVGFLWVFFFKSRLPVSSIYQTKTTCKNKLMIVFVSLKTISRPCFIVVYIALIYKSAFGRCTIQCLFTAIFCIRLRSWRKVWPFWSAHFYLVANTHERQTCVNVSVLA